MKFPIKKKNVKNDSIPISNESKSDIKPLDIKHETDICSTNDSFVNFEHLDIQDKSPSISKLIKVVNIQDTTINKHLSEDNLTSRSNFNTKSGSSPCHDIKELCKRNQDKSKTIAGKALVPIKSDLSKGDITSIKTHFSTYINTKLSEVRSVSPVRRRQSIAAIPQYGVNDLKLNTDTFSSQPLIKSFDSEKYNEDSTNSNITGNVRSVSYPTPKDDLSNTGSSLLNTFDLQEEDKDLKKQEDMINIRKPSSVDFSSLNVSESIIKKTKFCSQSCDFKNPKTDIILKRQKREYLLEIIDFVATGGQYLTDEVVYAILQMIETNIFRPLVLSQKYPSLIYSAEIDEDDVVFDSAWPHLRLVYEIFLRLIVCNDISVATLKKKIDPNLIFKLLELFVSEDPRERYYLKTILHRIYGKMVMLRGFIRKVLRDIFLCYIFNETSHNGLAEFLEVLGSIISGFALPLKEEHKVFLKKALLPLHKSSSLSSFFPQLMFCIILYLERDCSLLSMIITTLLKFWPNTNAANEILFLNEIEEILELSEPQEFKKIMVSLMKQFSNCIQSSHFQVVERVLFIWNNDYFIELFTQNKESLYPIVVSALYNNTNNHWHGTVHGLTYSVCKILAELDFELFTKCSDALTINQNYQRNIEDEALWQTLIEDYNNKNIKVLYK